MHKDIKQIIVISYNFSNNNIKYTLFLYGLSTCFCNKLFIVMDVMIYILIRLLVALTHHVIEIRDLSNKGEPTFSFPTVDQVCYMLYCATGRVIYLASCYLMVLIIFVLPLCITFKIV